MLKAGSSPRTLQPLLKVSGRALYAFVSTSPLYKDLSASLSSGSQSANVKALQRALRARGSYDGAIDGDFNAATESAFEDWQTDQGMSVTGTLDTTRFVWVPTKGIIDEWNVAIGDRVGSATVLARVIFKRPLLARAEVGQSDVTELKAGQSARLTVDGHDGATLEGTVVSVSETPSVDASGTAPSGAPSYAVTLKVSDLPAYARAGMTGTLSIELARTSGVLVVPTSAVVEIDGSTLVRVLQNGDPILRTVSVGLSTESLTEITAGLAEGEKVVTSTITSPEETDEAGGGGVLRDNIREREQ